MKRSFSFIHTLRSLFSWMLLTAMLATVTTASATEPGAARRRFLTYKVSLDRAQQDERILVVAPTDRVRTKVLREGFQAQKGHRAMQAFLAFVVERAVQQGALTQDFLAPDRILAMDIRGGGQPCSFVITLDATEDTNGDGALDFEDDLFTTAEIPYAERCGE